MKDIHKQQAYLFDCDEEEVSPEMRELAKVVYFADMYKGDPMNIQIALHRGDVFLTRNF